MTRLGPPYAAIAQSVERILGKDEVPSSNLGSSSKIPLESVDSGGISLHFATFLASLFLWFFVDPHRDPHAEMSEEGQRVPDRKFRLPAWLFCRFSVLHDLCHKISHCLCRPILLLPGGMGIGAESEACVVVSQHTADGLDVYTIL